MMKYLATAAILTAVATVRADEPATRPSNTAKATRVVRIDAPDVYLDVVRDFETNHLNQLVTDQSPGVVPSQLSLDQSAIGDAPAVVITVTADLQSGGTPSAAEFADSIVEQLKSRLAKLVQEQRATWKAQLDDQYNQMMRLQTRRIQLEQRIKLDDGDIADIEAMADLTDSSPQDLRQVVQTLEGQEETSEIDIHGKTARQTALTNAILNLSADVQGRVVNDQIAQQLQTVADLRQKELDHLQKLYASGNGSQTDMDQAAAALAEAKAAVLERKEAAAQAAGGDTLRTWTNDMLSLSVDMAELRARRDAIKARLEKLKQVADQLEAKRSERDSAQAALTDVNDQSDKLQGAAESSRGLSAAQPKLTVVESKDVPAK